MKYFYENSYVFKLELNILLSEFEFQNLLYVLFVLTSFEVVNITMYMKIINFQFVLWKYELKFLFYFYIMKVNNNLFLYTWR